MYDALESMVNNKFQDFRVNSSTLPLLYKQHVLWVPSYACIQASVYLDLILKAHM